MSSFVYGRTRSVQSAFQVKPSALGGSTRVYSPETENGLPSVPFLPSVRHLPPTRRSLSSFVLRYVWSSPHHARCCGESIHASITRSGGATMSISTTMVSLMRAVSFMSVRLSFHFDIAFEIAELVLPHVAVMREPIVDMFERSGVELVEAVAA